MTLCACDIMRQDAVTVTPRTTLRQLLEILVDHEISGVPVVDGESRLVGIVSQRDVLEYIRAQLAKDGEEVLDRQIWDCDALQLMETCLRSVSPNCSLSAVALLMRRNHIHRVMVVQGGDLLGVITTSDLLKPFESPDLVNLVWGKKETFRYFSPFRSAAAEARVAEKK